MFGIVSYWRAIVTLSLRRAVFQIFYLKNVVLEIPVRGHSASSKLVTFNRLVMVSY